MSTANLYAIPNATSWPVQVEASNVLPDFGNKPKEIFLLGLRRQVFGVRNCTLGSVPSVASTLLANGATPAVVQRQLRHSDVKVTLEHYAHLGDAQRTAVENRSARLVN